MVALFVILPIALTVVVLAFVFTREGILQAFTGANSAEFRDGLVGIGTVTALEQTGVTVNDQPQLRIALSVEGVDGVTFESRAKMIVPLAELAMLRPGLVVPVRYVPGRTDKVEIDRSDDMAAAQHAMDEIMVRKGLTTRTKLDIGARGIKTQAVVQALAVTGDIRHGHAKAELELVVTRPDGTTFPAPVTTYLPPRSTGAVQVGRVVEARYLPGDEHEVVIALPVNS
ncbi:MAG: hypothetical protein HOU01_26515 [Streptomycetaceae bacterium]|nr:hypothetical protein [Streptomycetaceae bacterium]